MKKRASWRAGLSKPARARLNYVENQLARLQNKPGKKAKKAPKEHPDRPMEPLELQAVLGGHERRHGRTSLTLKDVLEVITAHTDSLEDIKSILDAHTDRFTELEGRIDRAEAFKPFIKEAHERLDRFTTELAVTTERLGALEKDAHKLDEVDDNLAQAQARLDAVEARCTDLGHKADGAHTRVKAQQERVDELETRLDRYVMELSHKASAERVDSLETRADGLNSRLDELERFHPRLDAPEPVPETGRILAGGWVNIYSPDKSNTFDGSFVSCYATKQDADDAACPNRFACIRIADIVEGDGL
jgi:DNA repair exonuclease SbcCD ATPase subunit